MTVARGTGADGWTHSPVTGVLSRSVGPWGDRKRVFQKRAGGPFYCSVYLTDGRRHVRSLGTADPAEAMQLAVNTPDAAGSARASTCRVALGSLWD
jgi:hypothetical protein